MFESAKRSVGPVLLKLIPAKEIFALQSIDARRDEFLRGEFEGEGRQQWVDLVSDRERLTKTVQTTTEVTMTALSAMLVRTSTFLIVAPLLSLR